MSRDCSITAKVKRRQQAMFLEAANRGITHKELHYQTGLSLSIIGQYARGETAMGLPASMKVMDVVGTELFSMLFDDNLQIVDAPAEMDHSAVASACHDYMACKTAAHCPDSECGAEIGPNEDKALRGKAARLAVAK